MEDVGDEVGGVVAALSQDAVEAAQAEELAGGVAGLDQAVGVEQDLVAGGELEGGGGVLQAGADAEGKFLGGVEGDDAAGGAGLDARRGVGGGGGRGAGGTIRRGGQAGGVAVGRRRRKVGGRRFRSVGRRRSGKGRSRE